MLQTIKIKNVALISEAVINFDRGLNIISGETGAGKSVLLDCINLILGAKADKTLIKNGEDFLKVEAIFDAEDNSEVKKTFKELDLEFDNCIIISRKITNDGKNEVRLNGEIVPLSYIKNITKNLIDVHSQNENLTLLNKTKQLSLIDDFAEINKDELKDICNEIKKINEQINLLDTDEYFRKREIDLLQYQIDEIDKANISENEESSLMEELLLLKNAEKISNSLNIIKDCYNGGSINLSILAKRILSEINNLAKYKNNNSLEEQINSYFIDLDDSINEYINEFDIEFDENRFNEIDARLDLYKTLHKKYGNSYDDITKFYSNCKEKLDKFLNSEFEINRLKKEKNILLNKAYNLCANISNKRKTVAKMLESNIELELKELSMPNAKVEFSFNDYNKQDFEKLLTPNGADSVDMLFSANLGEKLNSLSLIASGGEISRLMLAIKTITSEKDKISTMIFDELDTGISGSASVATSKKLAKISKNHQIIAVSHLFQICAMADKNILVKKVEENGKTFSLPCEISGEDAVNELCRFLSVDKVTESTIAHAKEVKEYLDDYKKNI